MKKENVLVVALILIALGGFYLFNRLNSGQPSQAVPVFTENASVQTGSAQDINWKDFTSGMALARAEQKSVFLYFYAPWCIYCTKLKKTTFKDARVLEYLKQNFVSIHVDTDKSPSLAQDWQVKGLPTMFFLDPQGEKINRMPGYVDAGQLLQILKYIHTQSYTTMEFHEFVKQG
ncbi:MAG: thioredoxin fold domain-containing protein [Desulfobacter sp.]|nr:MAG: thioredoxin fold domain-containing protein [Desulfobacter sp.]